MEGRPETTFETILFLRKVNTGCTEASRLLLYRSLIRVACSTSHSAFLFTTTTQLAGQHVGLDVSAV
ncbi:hypothetical protein CYMTET_22854 [Cymbomonas tetramitiformis]|uniref:Uncharacterized protein n=1 Tax=Cymbomonas tetramitiformis TaxID=36881 RepID=A0AAE0L1P4_9CHLO|nr:hypothetical protein CYMTET_22854 [Cymbomonas tetramitiformis]